MAEVREITELFRLEKVLKSSPGGVVFRATDPGTGRKVGIKLINRGSSPDQEACRERFVEAVRTLQSLHLSCFPAILDYGLTPDGTAFIVMELLEGAPAEALVSSPPTRVLSLVGPLVDGLEALASRGISHHNLSPDNLLLAHGRTGELLIALGFGTMAFRPEGPVASRTGKDAAFTYLAPELLRQPGAAATADWRSDLYSLNLVVCHLLGARLTPPDYPEVDLPAAVREGLVDAEPLRSVLLSGLRHSPELRPPSYEAVRQAFSAALYGGSAPSREVERTEAFTIATVVDGGAAPARDAAPSTERTMAVSIHAPAPPPVVSPPPPAPPAPSAFVTTPAPPQQLSEPGVGDDDDLSRTMPIQIRPAVSAAAPPARPADTPPAELEEDWTPPAVVSLVTEAEAELEPVSLAEPAVPALPSVPKPAPPADPVSPGQVHGAAAALPPSPPALPSVPGTTMAFPVAPTFTPAPGPEPPAVSMPAWPAPAQGTPAGTATVPGVAAGGAMSRTAPTSAFAASTAAIPTKPPAQVQPDGVEGQPPSGDTREPAPPAAPPPPRPKRKGMPLWPLFLIIPLALAVFAGGLWFVGPKIVGALLTEPTPVPTPVRPTPSPAPQATQPPHGLAPIEDAESLFRAGDFEGASRAIELVTREDEDRLSRDDYERLRTLRDELAAQRAGSLLKDLDRGIRNGNVELLKRTVGALSAQDLEAAAADRKVDQQLTLARKAIGVQGELLKASRERNTAEVMRVAGNLLELLPRCSQATDLRDRAAATVESEADALARTGKLDAAIARLEELRAMWAERPGLDRRIERLRAEAETERKMTALMAEVARAEEEKQPERGLELLRGAPTGGKWEAQVAEARGRLERLLVELDKGAPSVQARPGWKAEYEKGKNALVLIKVADDYGVKAVSAMGRVEGAKSYTEIPVRRGPGSDYTIEVPSAFHRNETIELYVTATDASGHTGQLGKPEAPFKVKRKRWLF